MSATRYFHSVQGLTGTAEALGGLAHTSRYDEAPDRLKRRTQAFDSDCTAVKERGIDLREKLISEGRGDCENALEIERYALAVGASSVLDLRTEALGGGASDEHGAELVREPNRHRMWG